jgi:hypothetical protein
MIKGGVGGANTNKTGLKFEKDTDLKESFQKIEGYSVKDDEIYFNNKKVAELFQKNKLYKNLLEKHNIKWEERASSKLLPDEAILILINNTLFIIEKKFQFGSGSVDEKLQTCDFKKKKYEKLLKGTDIQVKFIYILNDWFNQERNKDTFDYIKSVGCEYYFNNLPLKVLGLPDLSKQDN